MSKFYGTVGDPFSRTSNGTRCGHSGIFAAAQSYDGSIITELQYVDDELHISVRYSQGSSNYRGSTIYEGTMADFLKVVALGQRTLREYRSVGKEVA